MSQAYSIITVKSARTNIAKTRQLHMQIRKTKATGRRVASLPQKFSGLSAASPTKKLDDRAVSSKPLIFNPIYGPTLPNSNANRAYLGHATHLFLAHADILFWHLESNT